MCKLDNSSNGPKVCANCNPQFPVLQAALSASLQRYTLAPHQSKPHSWIGSLTCIQCAYFDRTPGYMPSYNLFDQALIKYFYWNCIENIHNYLFIKLCFPTFFIQRSIKSKRFCDKNLKWLSTILAVYFFACSNLRLVSGKINMLVLNITCWIGVPI